MLLVEREVRVVECTRIDAEVDGLDEPATEKETDSEEVTGAASHQEVDLEEGEGTACSKASSTRCLQSTPSRRL